MAIADEIGFPIMVRPSFILGGHGTGIAHDRDDLRRGWPPRGSPPARSAEILVERSIAGWKEYELEVMRDHADNCVVVCSIENFDPMGVHTGDSITVAPAQTLSDVEYQAMRDDAFACLRRVGVETGGSNVQFAVDPSDGRRLVIEMNPRVSRSSALASKATGFPIAKIAARLAVGYRLDEITNDITRATPASFEPTIDYVVTKIPRWAFEKLPGADGRLGTRMQSVGEVMAIGRTFCESLQKALRSLEQGRAGLNADPAEAALRRRWTTTSCWPEPRWPPPSGSSRSRRPCAGGSSADALATPHRDRPVVPRPDRPHQRRAPSAGALVASAGGGPAALAAMDRPGSGGPSGSGSPTPSWPTSLGGARGRRSARARLAAGVGRHLQDGRHLRGRVRGPHAVPLLHLRGRGRGRAERRAAGWSSSARGPTGSGRASSSTTAACTPRWPCATAGYETVMVNCNPETVSTDYDTSDRLYFEPLTAEDVANVLDAEAAGRRGGWSG